MKHLFQHRLFIKVPQNGLFVKLLFLCGIWVGCSHPEKNTDQNKLFTQMSATQTGISFTNTIVDDEQFNIFSYRNFYNGGGVAIGDINNDSLPDIYFTANMGANQLYLNKGNMQFEEIGAKAGVIETGKWSTGVVMVDINADGWLDIYVCNAGYRKGLNTHNALFINNKNGTFTDSAAAYGLDNDGYSTHAAFFDYDLDGDLDCYILNNSFIPVNTLNNSNKRELRAKDWPVKEYLKGGGSYLMRNDGSKFTDVSAEAGIYGSLISFGLGVTVGDVNGDLYPDIYVSNDFFERDYLYINQKNGTFKEQVEQWTAHISQSSMGADLADINNDGFPDLFVTDMLPRDDQRLKTTTSFENYDVYQLKTNLGFYHQFMQNTLQVNNRNGRFVELAHFSGVAATDWSWGGLIFDADNDGLSDLYVCNGIARDLTDQDFIDFFANDIIQRMVVTGSKDKVKEVFEKMPTHPLKNKAFKNNGQLNFTDVGDAWGFDTPSFSNGAAYADLDRDGDLDLIVNNVNQQAFVYKNNSRQTNNNHFISVQLKGKEKNTFAIGSTIKVFQEKEIITREIIPGRGFQSSVDYTAVIGLGNKPADSLHIIWPDRTYTVVYNPTLDTFQSFHWPENAPLYPSISAALPPTLFKTVPSAVFEKHTEDNYVDFYLERNMPVMLSKEGPKTAIADVNNDGNDDVYIGGAAGKAGQLYVQSANGFQKTKQPDFELMAQFEDVATVFFDADKDGDQDLIVGSGGNHLQAGVREMQNRLYKNDGSGHFKLDVTALPENQGNTSTIAPYDFDGDGDMDVFIGSKSVPQQYGAMPTHYLLQNDGTGHFSQVEEHLFPALSTLGFITAACWADVDGDQRSELIVTGEMMPPSLFSWTKKGMVALPTNLQNLHGWWQSIAAADLDGDGDKDLVIGNMGTNCYLKPDSLHPIKLWFGDFDGNQQYDKVFTRTISGKDVPIFLKRDLTDQIPSLKKQNLRFESYATKSVQELFPPLQIQQAVKHQFNYAPSIVAINNGKGNFSILPLPKEVQFSTVQAICISDLNADGLPDLLLGGNQFAMMPQFGRLDGSFGHVLLNNGSGNFNWIEPKISGIQIDGAIKDIQPIKGAQHGFVVLRNNDFPVFCTLNASKAKRSASIRP